MWNEMYIKVSARKMRISKKDKEKPKFTGKKKIDPGE